jgi:hypothetical protein
MWTCVEVVAVANTYAVSHSGILAYFAIREAQDKKLISLFLKLPMRSVEEWQTESGKTSAILRSLHPAKIIY